MPDSQSMIAHSILYPHPAARPELSETPPACFPDLNLDQLVASITAGRDHYRLPPIFYTPLDDIAAIRYRQEVSRDMEDEALQEVSRTFARDMEQMRRYLHLAGQLDHRINQARWFVEAVKVYGRAVQELARMSAIVDHLSPQALVLFNESFAATNEREGAEIARQVTLALMASGVKISFVTHLYAFAHECRQREPQNVAFLRAERLPDSSRTFRMVPGEPLETSFGRNIYRQIFSEDDKK